jgi:hypothetical protein
VIDPLRAFAIDTSPNTLAAIKILCLDELVPSEAWSNEDLDPFRAIFGQIADQAQRSIAADPELLFAFSAVSPMTTEGPQSSSGYPPPF